MARRFRALTASRVDDLPSGCTCCALWERGSERLECGSVVEREELVTWIRGVQHEWGDCGRVAYESGESLGFVKYAPPRFFPQVARMPVPPDEDSVLIACLHVEAGLREAGLGKVLLQAALRDLVSRGERTVEAYAAAGPAGRGEDVPLMTVEFLLRQGFTVSRPHPHYPLMRLELRTLAAWTESLESVLESLQLPRALRERVPSPLARP